MTEIQEHIWFAIRSENVQVIRWALSLKEATNEMAEYIIRSKDYIAIISYHNLSENLIEKLFKRYQSDNKNISFKGILNHKNINYKWIELLSKYATNTEHNKIILMHKECRYEAYKQICQNILSKPNLANDRDLVEKVFRHQCLNQEFLEILSQCQSSAILERCIKYTNQHPTILPIIINTCKSYCEKNTQLSSYVDILKQIILREKMLSDEMVETVCMLIAPFVEQYSFPQTTRIKKSLNKYVTVLDILT